MSAGTRVPLGQWARELLLGARFAVSGGRAGWTRTLLTSFGVGLGVAVLLLAASVPTALTAGDIRKDNRDWASSEEVEKAEHTVLLSWVYTEFRDETVSGRELQAEGDPDKAVLPPGVDKLPAPGEALVSPALRDLLDTEDGRKYLQPRFDGLTITGTVGDQGLSGPSELLFYSGSDELEADSGHVWRVSGFGHSEPSNPLSVALVALVVVMLVVLLLPIAAFIATAVRFGGERRDQRLAALRLVGADNAMTRRVAAGESLVGAVFGLALGSWLFLLGRSQARSIDLYGIGLFPSDIAPGFLFTLLIVVLVPACAVGVTQLALRKVVISPLGVAREGVDRGRRLWWRLATLLLGVVLLFVLGPRFSGGGADIWLLAGSVMLTLVGVTSLLPWVVERVVDRLQGGSLSWQLATRRLQLNSGLAARAVSGVTLAVAGAVALQMLYSSVQREDERDTGMDTGQADVTVYSGVEGGSDGERLAGQIRELDGVRSAHGYLTGEAVHEKTRVNEYDVRESVTFTVADCPTLRYLLKIDSCADGSTYFALDPNLPKDERPKVPAAGDRYDLRADPEKARPENPDWWTVRGKVEQARVGQDASGSQAPYGLYTTPDALAPERLGGEAAAHVQVRMVADGAGRADGVERIRNLAPITDPSFSVQELRSKAQSDEFTVLSNALMAGSVLVMLLIGGSMVVSTLEQLRERRRQLSVLVAFGTKRSTLGASVLWQTAIPVGLGLTLATAGGLGLGLLLLRMIGGGVADWWAFLPMVGMGLAMIALVTLASLPALWRMMRPDGLRTE
ncbi:ABC transporter permease [Streptomyces sp. P38-E01]|uniref:ABC transporter permease n=1 Tax=Streptomyces tardus TaxID=2780544 RepID=A0A949N5M9_9ACTN|nr:FtsX-like permease family protein [Streptomyces tardus]MBU7599119.1 ABC transporter permease [Streptomyces tardus]